MSKTYVKAPEAPEHFQPDVEPGQTFDADYDDGTHTALVAAGWVQLADKKKGDK